MMMVVLADRFELQHHHFGLHFLTLNNIIFSSPDTDEISDVTQIRFNTFSTDSILVVRNVGQLKNITVKYVDLTLCESFVLPPATDVVIVDHVCASSSLLQFFKIIINSILIVTILEFDKMKAAVPVIQSKIEHPYLNVDNNNYHIYHSVSTPLSRSISVHFTHTCSMCTLHLHYQTSVQRL